MVSLSKIAECRLFLSELMPHKRIILFERLFKERLYIKQKSIMQTFKEVGEEWNQTLYTTLLKYLGSTHNGSSQSRY